MTALHKAGNAVLSSAAGWLEAGLRWYIEGFKERATSKLPENLERLPPGLELRIFRVVQERLTNVHRHSENPTTAEKLAAATGPGKAGVRLRGMRERVKAFGGELEILSDIESTVVRAVIPLLSSASGGDA